MTEIISSSLLGLPIKYVVEEHVGKSHAENKGIAEAKGHILAFTDDDCIVDPNWVSSISSEFSTDPSLAGLGGRVELFNKEDRPVSIRTINEKLEFSSPDQLFKIFIGCNMAFTRNVFDEVGLFDPDLGPGTRFQDAEDSDLIYRTFKQGLKIIYSPHVLVFHDHGRRTLAAVDKAQKGYHIGRGAFYWKHISRGDRNIAQLAYKEAMALTKRMVKNFIRFKTIRPQFLCLWALAVGFIHKATTARPSQAS